MTTDWLYSDYLRPLRINGQHPPCRPDFHVGIPFGGILFRDLPKIRELPSAAEYAALLKRLVVSTVVHERAPNAAGTLGARD